MKILCGEKKIILEDNNDISVDDSLATTKYVAGSFSTILYQAFCLGKKVVIDDVSNDMMIEYLFKNPFSL